jgi:two-component system, NarL family, sensor histidine kinase BarA
MKQEKGAARRALQPRNRRLIRRSGRKLRVAISAFASIIVLGTVLLLASVAIEQKESAEDRAWNDAANLTGAFEEQIRRVMDSVRGAIALLKPRLAAEGAAFDFVDWTKHVPEFATSTAQIAFVGPDGVLVASSLTHTPKKVDLSDREHIRVQLDRSHQGLFIGKPVIGRISGQPTIQVTDRIENEEGGLTGIIVFSLSPEFLTTLHRAVNLGRTGTMILAGTDGVIRASFGKWQKSDLEFIGKAIPDAKPIVDARGAESGAYRGLNPLNGQPGFFQWRKVKNDPLIVIVGISEAEVFEVANHSAMMLGALGAGVLILSLTTTLILYREIARRVRREVALFDESRKLVLANGNLQRRHRQLRSASAALNAERTRLQELNAQLASAKEQADKANQAKTSFLMNMSHEFRTPMHAILNYTSMSLKKLPEAEPEKLKKFLTNIQVSGLRLLELLNALLDLAKLESGKFELKLSRGDMTQIIRQSQAELGSLFESKQIEFRMDCRSSDPTGLFDKERLMQVFINLLSNAIKFSPKGGVIEVAVNDGDLPEHGPAFHCVVSDQGVGIPKAELETIFLKFEQSSKTSGAGGSGLGLAICREIVHLHRGAIWAATALSGGAAIHLLIPKEAVAEDAAEVLDLACWS